MRLELTSDFGYRALSAVEKLFRVAFVFYHVASSSTYGVVLFVQHVWCSFVLLLWWYRNPIKGWLCCRVPFTSYWRSLSGSLSKITILHSAGCAFLRASFVCHCAAEVAANPLSSERTFCESFEPEQQTNKPKTNLIPHSATLNSTSLEKIKKIESHILGRFNQYQDARNLRDSLLHF